MCSLASIDAPGNSKPEGATGELSQEGGFQKEALLSDELKSQIEKSSASIYEVKKLVMEALKNPVVLVLLIICIGVILSFYIFLGYKKRKRA